MARVVRVKVLDGNQDTLKETIVSYQIGIPNDVLFYTSNGITYAQFWNMERQLVAIPCFQLLSID